MTTPDDGRNHGGAKISNDEGNVIIELEGRDLLF